MASQAAVAIANMSARADLEALAETLAVGIAVFDAKTGRPLSFNGEARRILESLRMPGHPPERLLEAVSLRRATGAR